MKNLKLFYFLLILASSFVFIQCTSDPIAGDSGLNGIDGIDGIDGVDGSAEVCIACHSNQHRDPIRAAYAISGHKMGIDVKRDGILVPHVFGGLMTNSTTGAVSDRTFCSQCHSNQGFIYKAENGVAGPTAVIPNLQSISCTGCHNSTAGHRSFDFANDGNDYALRFIEAQTFTIDPSTIIDAGDHSNICIKCHQPRPDSAGEAFPPIGSDLNALFVVYDSAATVTHDGLRHRNTNISAHESGQSALWAGKLVFQLPGGVTYPTTNAHKEGVNGVTASCVTCHMGTPSSATAPVDGAHSFHATASKCITCHGATIPTEVTGFHADMDALLASLAAKGVTNATGSLQKGSYKLGFVQAFWNWKLIEGERSEGKHNPALTKAVLKNSKTWVDANTIN